MISHRTKALVFLLSLAPLLLGCGHGQKLERLPVHGIVTMASGERLNGSVTFVPAKGQTGPSVTVKLEEGKYQFDRNNGPVAGPYSAILRRTVSRASELKAMTARQPVKKNQEEWVRSATVANDGQFQCDFSLEK